jgi:hypothetical protein
MNTHAKYQTSVPFLEKVTVVQTAGRSENAAVPE